MNCRHFKLPTSLLWSTGPRATSGVLNRSAGIERAQSVSDGWPAVKSQQEPILPSTLLHVLGKAGDDGSRALAAP